MDCPCGKSECVRPTDNPKLRLRPGMVVVTEGAKRDLVGALVMWATGSRLTHCFVVTGPDELVEAYVPRVHKTSLTKRINELQRGDRAYYILDLPGITLQQRCLLVQRVREYVGRFYDLGQILLYGIIRRFRNDGAGTLTCSRLVTALFKEALSIDLFESVDESALDAGELLKGECLPSDLLKSKLVVQRLVPSSRIRR